MRVLLNSSGTRGDVQPMLALAYGLRSRGHEVTIAAGANFRQWIESNGFKFAGTQGDVEALVRNQWSRPKLELLKEARSTTRLPFDLIESMPDADLVVGSGLCMSVPTHAEVRGIPGAYVLFAPDFFDSKQVPPMLPFRAPRWSWGFFARVMHWLSDWTLALNKTINSERTQRGLGRINDWVGHYLTENILFAAAEPLAPLPPDAPKSTSQCGPFFLPEREEIDSELEEFLNAGPAPVYVGFGSMSDPKPEKTTRMILEAVHATGVRALISSGWAGLGAQSLPPAVRVIGSAPHGKLFPRCSVIVHHGGAGTTHAAARAGVPQVIVPHGFDQFGWAFAAADAGIAPQPFPRRSLTAKRLANAIRQCLTDAGLRERAKAVAERIPTDGVDRAVDYLERLVASAKSQSETDAASVIRTESSAS